MVRQFVIASGYGFVAGVVAAAVLKLMNVVTLLLWHGHDQPGRLHIFGVIMVGGALIALIRHFTQGFESGLGQQIQDARDPVHIRHRLVLLVAAAAVVSVGFGGALGPEAGIVAVITEISAVMGLLLARNAQDRQLIGEAGVAGALSGLYGSPPSGAMLSDAEGLRTPLPVLLAAGVAGLLGFLLAASHWLGGGEFRVHLPAYAAPGDGLDMLRAVLPAALGALAGLGFVWVLGPIKALLARLGSPVVQTLVGTAAFALLAALLPILRFSGHHEMEAMLAWGRSSGMALLMGLALLKVLALALCLAAGWRGGAAFPLIFAGAAAGAAALWLAPGTAPTVALLAGMTAAVTVGMGKPAAAALIIVFMVSPFAAGPLCVGALIGWGASMLGPKPVLH
jgi:H+/Cl- antiporter ClcA